MVRGEPSKNKRQQNSAHYDWIKAVAEECAKYQSKHSQIM